MFRLRSAAVLLVQLAMTSGSSVLPGAPVPAQSPASGQPLSIDLPGALQRARDYNQQFMQAGIAAGLAREDRVQAKAALLPSSTP